MKTICPENGSRRLTAPLTLLLPLLVAPPHSLLSSAFRRLPERGREAWPAPHLPAESRGQLCGDRTAVKA